MIKKYIAFNTTVLDDGFGDFINLLDIMSTFLKHFKLNNNVGILCYVFVNEERINICRDKLKQFFSRFHANTNYFVKDNKSLNFQTIRDSHLKAICLSIDCSTLTPINDLLKTKGSNYVQLLRVNEFGGICVKGGNSNEPLIHEATLGLGKQRLGIFIGDNDQLTLSVKSTQNCIINFYNHNPYFAKVVCELLVKQPFNKPIELYIANDDNMIKKVFGNCLIANIANPLRGMLL